MFPKPECLAWLTIYFTLSFATAALNAITIVVFRKHRNLRNRSAYLIINLAVADMLVGGFSTFDLSYHYGSICNIWTSDSGISFYLRIAIAYLFLVCSLANVTAISLERVHATFWPFKHRVIKKQVYNVIIAVTWITSGSMSLAYITLTEFKTWSIYFYLWNSFNTICLSVICISYASIFVKVRYSSQGLHLSASTRERKLTVILFIVTFLSLVLWLPYIVNRLLMEASNYSIMLPFSLQLFFAFSFHINSFINPILYLIKIPGFRRAFIGLFKIRCPQKRQVQVFPY